MSISVPRTTEPLRFDVGIGQAGYADIIDSPVSGQPQKTLLPGSTTVSQAIDGLFPTDENVSEEVMRALVADNTPHLRTPSGFNNMAREAARSLRSLSFGAADGAAREIENLLADGDLLERCRMALLET